MNVSAGKLAPSAVVVAFVGYCVWPSVANLTSSPVAPAAAGKVAELATSLFSPKLGPAPTKNPFGGLDAEALAQAAKDQDREVKDPGEKNSGAKPRIRRADPLVGLKLDATSIFGDQRMAVINGEIYLQNQHLAAGGNSMPARKVLRILPDMVVLECQGKTAELKYSNVGKPSAPQGKTAARQPGEPEEQSLLSRLKKLSAASNNAKPSEKTPSTKAGN